MQVSWIAWDRIAQMELPKRGQARIIFDAVGSMWSRQQRQLHTRDLGPLTVFGREPCVVQNDEGGGSGILFKAKSLLRSHLQKYHERALNFLNFL